MGPTLAHATTAAAAGRVPTMSTKPEPIRCTECGATGPDSELGVDWCCYSCAMPFRLTDRDWRQLDLKLGLHEWKSEGRVN